MESRKTQRGFCVSEFKDKMGEKCSLQESSIMNEEGLVWFGCDQLKVEHFKQDIDNHGWQVVNLQELLGPGDIVSNNRMLLSQSMVKKLLPALEHFAEHGVLPNE